MTNHFGSLDTIKELSGKDVTRIFYEIHSKSNFEEKINCTIEKE
jgi:cytochrome b involved in lipid metabolism